MFASAVSSRTPVGACHRALWPSLTSATAGNGQVSLAWSAPASNGGSTITGYTATASPGGATCSSAGTSCTVLGLTNGTGYSFTVTATNAVGTGAPSNALSATPVAPATNTVPSAPQNLTATQAKPRGVSLAWSAPTSNGGTAITGYRIYRGTTAGCETLYASVGAVLKYKDVGATSRVMYYYKVVAVNAMGVSPFSNEASVTAR